MAFAPALLTVARRQQRPCIAALSAHARSWQTRSYHVAIVGSGPAGFYTSKYLLKEAAKLNLGEMRVDMLERLPTPFGLVRFGVAPDHPEVKNVINDFNEVAQLPSFRFLGNVEVGKDLGLSDLRSMYDAVVMCTGAQGERLLGIPGEELEGVVGAPAFVKWYNGHPDFAGLEPRAPGETAVVIGQGNVALDVARLLVRPPEELQSTDMEASALQRIGEWQRNGLRTVQLVGRRGFVQAAFTNAELRELLTISPAVLPVVDPEELALSENPASREELSKNRAKKRSVGILEKMAANFEQRHTTSKRVIWLRFLLSPTAFLPSAGSTAVEGLRLQRTELQGEPGRQAAVPTSVSEDVTCGLVVRSVGFDLTPIEGLPLGERRRVPHQRGRVEPPAIGAGGLYVSGWVKRGPQGIIGSNIDDARETAACVLKDLEQFKGTAVGSGAGELDSALKAAGSRVVSFADWQRLEAEEAARGQASGRPACKLTDVPEMLRLLS